MAQRKAEQENVGESLEDDEIKDTKAEKKTQVKYIPATFVGSLFCMNKAFYNVSNIHNDCTLSTIISNQHLSLLCKTQV